MSTQESVKITVENLRVICEKCVAVAKVHHVGPLRGLERVVRIECHGQHRLVALHHFATRVAELATPGEVNLLWCQMADVVPDGGLRDYLALIVGRADEVRRLPDDVADRDEYVRELEVLAEHVRAVMRSRCGESS